MKSSLAFPVTIRILWQISTVIFVCLLCMTLVCSQDPIQTKTEAKPPVDKDERLFEENTNKSAPDAECPASSRSNSPTVIDYLTNEPEYVDYLLKHKRGSVKLASSMRGDDIIVEDEDGTLAREEILVNNGTSATDAMDMDGSESITSLIKSYYRKLRANLWSKLENFTPQNVFKGIHQSKATVLGSVVVLSMLGAVSIFIYWTFKMPQLCLASFQVNLQSFPWWVYWPCTAIFATICTLYTLAEGDLYRFYNNLYETGQLSMFKAISLGVAQLFIRILCSFAVASIAILPPIWLIVWICDRLFSDPLTASKARASRTEKIRQKLSNYEFGRYLNWVLIGSLVSYAVLAAFVAKGIISKDHLYDIHVLNTSNL
jgi:hypothetical protein